MASLCCPSIKPYRDRPNVQPHDDKFTAFLGTYPTCSISDGTGITSSNAFVVQLVQQVKDTQEPVQKRYFHCYYGDKVSPPAPASVGEQELKRKTSSSGTEQGGRSQPYRPPAITTQAESMRRPSYTYGSGWKDQRSSGSSGPPSRRSFGPPSWVSPEVADSKPNWRNPARAPSTTSTSTASTSPTSPTSPRGPFGRTQGSFGFNRGGRNGVRKSPVSPRGPTSSSADTSGWETASNATNSTLQNRFALLRDGASTTYDSDNSEELDSAHLERVRAVVAQDDDDDYILPSTLGAASGSSSWRKDSRLKVVEIGEHQVKRSGLIKDRNSKMFICPLHDTIFELHLYVPDVVDS